MKSLKGVSEVIKEESNRILAVRRAPQSIDGIGYTRRNFETPQLRKSTCAEAALGRASQPAAAFVGAGPASTVAVPRLKLPQQRLGSGPDTPRRKTAAAERGGQRQPSVLWVTDGIS